MAYLESFIPFDINSVNLNWYDEFFEDSGLENNVYLDVGGVIYEDFYWVDAYDGWDWLELVFLGSGITENVFGEVTAGTVKLVGEFDLFSESLLWFVDGVSISAVAIYNAALTPSNSDEIAIIQTALAGDDTLYLSAYDDRMSGFTGNDDIDGGAGNDELYGGSGDDLFIGGAGDDFLAGEDGFDIVSYEFALAGVTVNLQNGTGRGTASGDVASVGFDTFSSIEVASGSDFTDHLTAANWDSHLIGWDGNDTLVGGLGWDDLVGGNQDDLITGGLGSDLLYGDEGLGDTGNDTFRDTAAGFNTDIIGDFGARDTIVITDANFATFTYSLDGTTTTLSYTGGSLTLSAPVNGQLVASAAVGGGVQLTISDEVRDAANDFNGDGRSDILWRHEGGLTINWLGEADGGFADNYNNSIVNIPTEWHVDGLGDFNGDGRDDILWRHDNGLTLNWLGQANGGFTDNYTNSVVSIPTTWQVQGIGDFNGDGKDDILWRDETGLTINWLGQANGSFADNYVNSVVSIPTNWSVAAVGDFNGDGKDDILWREAGGLTIDWLGEADGGFADNYTNSIVNIPTNWQIEGVGDFNGDGRDDILWRNEGGQVVNWLAQANGGFADNYTNSIVNIPTTWQVASIGDFNGDGRDDILWRNDDGLIVDWLGEADGGFADNYSNSVISIPITWHVQAPELL